jgi:hypothetical protein
MRTCQPCPEVFPWTGKTGVRNPFLDHYGENEVASAWTKSRLENEGEQMT